MRAVAARLAVQILERRQPMDSLLAAAFGPKGELRNAKRSDRALVRLILSTMLRHLGQIDRLLAPLIERPLPHAAMYEKAVLRLGVAQLVFLSMPAHAVVDEAVASLRSKSPYRGLVNALLRKLATLPRDDSKAPSLPSINVPEWLWQSWVQTYGQEIAEAMAAQHLVEPPLDLSVIGDCATVAEKLAGQALPQGSVRLARAGIIDQLPGYAAGEWWVQDAAATLPVKLLQPQPGEFILDLCAAPGGKSAQMAARGAHVVAIDRAAARSKRVTENLERLGLKAEIVVADVLNWQPERLADAVLLDAPCSATGTLRRHPDVPWTKQPHDLIKLTETQDQLLIAAAQMVRPGGRLVYCVCSLEECEGAPRIEKFLATPNGKNFRRDPVIPAELPELHQAITADGDLRTLPHYWSDLGGMDGFYACRLVRL